MRHRKVYCIPKIPSPRGHYITYQLNGGLLKSITHQQTHELRVEMEGPLLIWIALCALYLLVLLFLRVVYIQVCISKVVVTPLHTCTYVSSVNLDANLYHEYLPLQSSFHCHFGSLIVSFVVVIIITFPICICLSCLTSNIKEDISIW